MQNILYICIENKTETALTSTDADKDIRKYSCNESLDGMRVEAHTRKAFLFQNVMKYTVNINQVAAAAIAPELDFADLAIYDFIKSFATSGNCTTINEGGRSYYWIAHTVIMSELPLLHITTKRGIAKRIENLINAGILQKYDKCAELGRTYYTFGINAARLESTTPRTKVQGGMNESSGGYEQKFRGGMNENSGDYYNNNINDIIDNSTPAPENAIENAIENGVEAVDVEEIPDLMTAAEPTPPSSAAPPRPKSASAKTLFRNSGAADRDKFFKTFGGEEYAAIDMEYYYNAVADWSDSSNTMRTECGWYATVRTFIRGDKEKGKLHKKINAAAAAATEIDWSYATKYLNM